MKKKVVWLCAVRCVLCKEIVYCQVGDKAISNESWQTIKCCDDQKIEASYTPVEV